MTFRNKVLFGFTSAIAVLVLIGAANVFILFEQFNSVDQLSGTAYRTKEITHSGRTLITAIHLEVLEAFISDADAQADSLDRLDDLAARFYRVVDILAVLQPENTVPADVLNEDFRSYFLFAKQLLVKYATLEKTPVPADDLAAFNELKRAMLHSLNSLFDAHEGAFSTRMEEMRDSALVMRWTSLLMAVVGGLAATVVAVLLSGQLTAPISVLTRMAKRAAGGNYGVRAPESGDDEVGELAVAFNQMLDKIENNVGVLHDEIAKRVETEKDLREARRKFQTIFETAKDAIFMMERESGQILECNEYAQQLYGYSRSELLTMRNVDVSVEQEQTKEVYRSATTFVPVRWHKRKNGDIFPVEISISYFERDGVDYAISIIRDIAPRMENEKALRRSEERYRNLFNASNEAILIVDNGVILESNARANDLFGGDEGGLVGWHFGTLSYEDGVEYGRAELEKHFYSAQSIELHEFEWLLRGGQGNILSVEIAISLLDVVSATAQLVVVRDITDRKHMQEIMVQTEKMMSVGGLAAGMAHEINNPLGIIMQSAENLERRTSLDHKANQRAADAVGVDLVLVREYLQRRNVLLYVEAMREAGDRAAQIVRNMLDFSRKSESRRMVCSVDVMLDRILELAGNDYDLKKKYDFRKINIIRERDEALPCVFCTQTEIEQVLLNLIKNAAQALAGISADAGEPTITLRSAQENDYIRIDVEDNGPGMDEDVRKRIFEPFFTTKPPGTGTGLGLSVSYFIVTRNHGGRFLVDSAPGAGTKFTILLPLVTPETINA